MEDLKREFRMPYLRQLADGTYELNGSGTVEYKVKIYRTTGDWKGFMAETDKGVKIHIPSGKLGDFREAVAEATQRRINRNVGNTRVEGTNSGVYLSDRADSVTVSDNEGLRLVKSIDEFIAKERTMNKLGNEI